jgi:hypothetical protein
MRTESQNIFIYSNNWTEIIPNFSLSLFKVESLDSFYIEEFIENSWVNQVLVDANTTYEQNTEALKLRVKAFENSIYINYYLEGPSDISTEGLQNLEIQLAWNIDFSTLYSEPVELDSDENIIQIKYWESESKEINLYTKDIIYTDGNPTLVTLTDNLTNKQLISTINYNIAGDWLNTTKEII